MSDLFKFAHQNRSNQAYKIYIEPYSGGSPDFLGYNDNDEIVSAVHKKLEVINPGYKKLFNEDLYTAASGIDWTTSTIVGDADDENSSLNFTYTADWGDSKISDIIGDFIPSAVTAGTGRILAKAATVGAKVGSGALAYAGTYPALNLNDRKTFASAPFLTYNLKIKVVDKEASGEVLKTLCKLLIYTAPQTIIEGISLEEARAAGENALKPDNAEGTKGAPIGKQEVDSPSTTQNIIIIINGIAYNALKDAKGTVQLLEKAAIKLTGITPKIELISSPIPLKIFVSDYYVHNLCVITSLGVNLSKQINSNGYPVYGTFDISISSREKVPLDLGIDDKSDMPTILRNINFNIKNGSNTTVKPQMLLNKSEQVK